MLRSKKNWVGTGAHKTYFDPNTGQELNHEYQKRNHESAMKMRDVTGWTEEERRRVNAYEHHEATIEEPYGFIKKGSFYEWYSGLVEKLNIDKNPDHYKHYYDYRAAHKAGAKLSKDNHLPSEFKHDLHPNRYIVDKKTLDIRDSKYNKKAKLEDMIMQSFKRKEYEESLF